MINITKKSDCTGCSACYNICPENCIIMEKDDEGFLYPRVDGASCINCGLCEQVCQVINHDTFVTTSTAYACYNKNDNIRMNSSSGGIFTILAEQIISQGGYVFGAAFDYDDFSVKHILINSFEKLNLLRRSKYVQSIIGNTYKEAKKILQKGDLVLFTGTPCQINGLKNYLHKDYENLFCVDIICHGVPSPLLWRKYIDYFEDLHHLKIVDINFRCKDRSWENFGMKYKGKNLTYIFSSKDTDPFMLMFLRNYCLRPSCYQCPSKTIRAADITLGDFWGIENVVPGYDDGKGISLAIVRTKKGLELFDMVNNSMVCREVSYERAISGNPSEVKSVSYPEGRKNFFQKLNTDGFEALIPEFAVPFRSSFTKRAMQRSKKIIKKFIMRCGGGKSGFCL